MKKLLPQANSLNKVIDVFIYTSTMNNWTLLDISDFCKFSARQSSYYINACHYLNLLNEDGTLTDEGRDIISNPKKIKECVFEKVISDELVSKIFAKYLIEGQKSARKYCFSFLRSEYPDYSDAVIERRTSTLLNWCFEIQDFINKKS